MKNISVIGQSKCIVRYLEESGNLIQKHEVQIRIRDRLNMKQKRYRFEHFILISLVMNWIVSWEMKWKSLKHVRKEKSTLTSNNCIDFDHCEREIFRDTEFKSLAFVPYCSHCVRQMLTQLALWQFVSRTIIATDFVNIIRAISIENVQLQLTGYITNSMPLPQETTVPMWHALLAVWKYSFHYARQIYAPCKDKGNMFRNWHSK